MDFLAALDACEACLLDTSIPAVECVKSPKVASPVGDELRCIYECARHGRTWATNWSLKALGMGAA